MNTRKSLACSGALPPVRQCLPVIFGVQGHSLTRDEKLFFADHPPFGFIIFARNVHSKDQLRQLTQEMRQVVGFENIPILSDEEGGRVARLASIDDRCKTPSVRKIAQSGQQACYDHYFQIACAMSDVGLSVNCAPVLDMATLDTASFLQDRVLGQEALPISILGRACIQGLHAGGIQAIFKHMPGHGLARLDSHIGLPKIDLGLEQMADHLRPFQALANMGAWGMSSHLLIPEIDSELPVTLSATACQELILRHPVEQFSDRTGFSCGKSAIATRCNGAMDSGMSGVRVSGGEVSGGGVSGGCMSGVRMSGGGIGFGGFLISDDLMMGALDRWSLALRVRLALGAGHDSVLVCQGTPSQWYDAVKGLDAMSADQLEKAGFSRQTIWGKPPCPTSVHSPLKMSIKNVYQKHKASEPSCDLIPPR
jgi:beta-N-acetylhexosaminidase